MPEAQVPQRLNDLEFGLLSLTTVAALWEDEI